MENRLANPAPLGLAGFALTTTLLSLINAGLLPAAGMGMVLACAFAFGGSAQFVAGYTEFSRGNTFGMTAFCGYGAFWWSFALFVALFAKDVPAAFVGWYLLLWGLFTFYLLIASLALNRAVQSVFLALVITFLLLAAGAFSGAAALTAWGGYFGLLTAALAWYLSAAEVINEAHGRSVLPVGAKRPA